MLAIGRRTEGRAGRLVSSAASLTGEQHSGRGECKVEIGHPIAIGHAKRFFAGEI